MFNAISELLYKVFNIFLSALPVADPVIVQFAGAYTSDLQSGMATMNWLFPVDTIFLVLRIMLSIEGSILFWKILKTIIKISPAGWGSSW